MRFFICILVLIGCFGCHSNAVTEKYQDERNRIVDVKDRVKAFDAEEVLIGGFAQPYLLGNYLLIADHKSLDKLVHVFDSQTLCYITSCVNRGEGPEEVLNMGCLGIDETRRIFYVSDHAKLKIFSYPIDSVLANPFYVHQVKAEMNANQFPSEYQYINDTLCIGRVICPIGVNDYRPCVAKWNMLTGEIIPYTYEYPNMPKKRATCAASIENNIYVECYSKYDLMTICSLDGQLKCNVYGPNWEKESNDNTYFGMPIICKDKILVPYSGGKTRSDEYYPTKVLIFDVDGEYFQTLNIGYKINNFCYDKYNNQLILNFNDDIQLATLSMDGII